MSGNSLLLSDSLFAPLSSVLCGPTLTHSSQLGMLLTRRPSPENEGELFVQLMREEDVSDIMLTTLEGFARTFGFEGVAVDEPGPVCTASVDAYGQTYVLWMAWMPGFEQMQLGDRLNDEYGYLGLARGRTVTVLADEDFFKS